MATTLNGAQRQLAQLERRHTPRVRVRIEPVSDGFIVYLDGRIVARFYGISYEDI